MEEIMMNKSTSFDTEQTNVENTGEESARVKEENEHSSKKDASIEKKKTLKSLLFLLIKICIIGIAVWILLTFVFGVFVTHSNDMFPAVRDGDLCLTLRVAKLYRGDIVAYREGDAIRFGRIAAMEGDVVDMDEHGNYTINGNIPFETVYYATCSAEQSEIVFPYTVEKDEFFLLNDYRESVKDSRIFGGIAKKDTLGKTVLLLRRRGF